MATSTAPLKIPETMTPKEIGSYMCGLREHFKLSVQDVSEQLHIRVRYVQAIEQGQLEQMPGKVYARGYVHTYAEFLGLDAEQVVTQCFAAEPPPVAPVPVPPRTLATARHPLMRNWRSSGISAVVVIALLVVVSQLIGGEDSQEEVATVEPVPETMLESVRTLVMPTSQNIRCLRGDLALSCFYADNMTRKIMDMDQFNRVLLVGDMDLSDLPLPVAPVEEAAEEEAAEEAPTKKAAASTVPSADAAAVPAAAATPAEAPPAELPENTAPVAEPTPHD